MNACIFAGPTLPPQEDVRGQDAVWLPPAKHGDVQRAVSLLRPRAIGLVDGYFQWTPSVWHKEILWALQQGVHVFGAASMGALRAAELAPFGMQGVGRIFEGYRDGVLAGCGDAPFEDDDEVAVIHGPAESGYLAASEAMVDIRCTLAEAGRAGLIGSATQVRLLAIAKALYFPERGYARLFEHARAAGLPGTELAALQDWLPAGRVRQKRADALLMVETLRAFLAQDPPPVAARFTFEHTTLWERAFAGARAATMHDAAETQALEELRLDAARWDAVQREALRSLMALPAAPPPAPGAFAQPLDAAAKTEAARRLAEDIPPSIVERRMLAQLRATGEFEPLRARAEDKRARLAARRDLPAAAEFPDLKLLELRDWYFSQVLHADMPDDLERWLQSAGYADAAHFHGVVFHEFVYRQMTGAEQAA